jgi:hypothetical protein
MAEDAARELARNSPTCAVTPTLRVTSRLIHSRVVSAVSEADSVVTVDSEAAPRKVRGRPAVFSADALRGAAGYSYARRIGTRRGAQDLVYRMFAIAVVEHYCEAYPEKADTLSWLLRPKRRHALLSELGRFGQPRSDTSGALRWSEEDVSRLIDAALEVSESRPTTKAGIAMLRRLRRSGRGRFAT